MKKKLMIVSVLFAPLVFAFAMILMPLKEAPVTKGHERMAIEHVNVVDVIDGTVDRDVTLVIENGLISTIVPSSDYVANETHLTVDGAGKFVIPGLWDMHTHSIKLSPQLHHPLYIANGVTGVRDMSGCMHQNDSFWGCIEDRERWNQDALDGDRVSPRYVLQSSFQSDGGAEVPEDFPSFFKLGNEADVDKLVDFYKASGADFLKVHHQVSLEQYNLLVASAAKLDMNIAGHKPLEVPLHRALEVKQSSIEHGRIFLLECFEDIKTYQTLANPIPYNNADFLRRLLVEQNSERCSALMASMANSESWWVPTFSTLRSAANANNAEFLADARLKFVPYLIENLFWSPDVGRAAKKGFDSEGNFVHGDLYNKSIQQVGEAHKQGVKLMAGTDSLDSYVFAGSSIHDELIVFVEAGLTPLQALQTATISPAQFSKKEHLFGSIDEGKVADFILLDANPLEDIRHIKAIDSVIFNGVYHDRQALDTLEEYAAEQGQSTQVNLRFLSDVLNSPLMRMQLAD